MIIFSRNAKIMENLVKGTLETEWKRDWVTIPDACLSLLPQDMPVISQFQSASHYKEARIKTWMKEPEILYQFK